MQLLVHSSDFNLKSTLSSWYVCADFYAGKAPSVLTADVMAQQPSLHASLTIALKTEISSRSDSIAQQAPTLLQLHDTPHSEARSHLLHAAWQSGCQKCRSAHCSQTEAKPAWVCWLGCPQCCCHLLLLPAPALGNACNDTGIESTLMT